MPDVQYTGIGHRRSHPKSRLGCANCKRRRIKCDESKPRCKNCTRHSVICSFSATSQQSPNSSTNSPASTATIRRENSAPSEAHAVEENNYSVEWGPITAELMHNYTTTTCISISDNPIMQTFMQTNIPRIGFANEHVLHMILGLSALHLARFNPNRERFYLDHANRHYQAGLRVATSLLSSLNEENCHSLYLFSNLCTSFTLARGPVPGDFLLFSDNGPAEWMALFRGAHPVFDSYGEAIKNGPLAPMINDGIQAISRTQQPLPPEEMEQLTYLRGMIEATSASPEEACILNDNMDQLVRLFSSRYIGEGRKAQAQFRSIGIWLYRCSNDFTTLLRQHNPVALTIFAYSCVALNDLSANWVMGGWVPHILTGVHERLPLAYHPWIQWPIQQIGWIPPTSSPTSTVGRDIREGNAG
ncbi:hypothetical protein K505DRAFT_228934 [Melanomma pulvis-pyrius CBS 109.77]|uniref:Zn(2)-C6 fungal-type domain-containing protein n=1 Tax=Melanomma pulvis-pyrius CBS 109.77 TaxID=1314802 RepID=A0A6A6XWG3_9PLEO|nr:hypothetical protein K505DRAFT_228934 [Melanomma pulvis-pyrius CBS 109.77]